MRSRTSASATSTCRCCLTASGPQSRRRRRRREPRLMDAGVLAAASELARARRAFALATVVWRRGPNSGRVGSKAIVFADGTVQGWLGGACSEPVVVREALAALADGQPRLCFLGSDDDFGALTRDGMAIVPMACANEGALEVYVEPFVPGPQVVVVGRSPEVQPLTR